VCSSCSGQPSAVNCSVEFKEQVIRALATSEESSV
jgi:hypothetical protein